MLKENLDELQQTVNLLQSENHDEFYDMSVRNKKYSRVDALNGPVLLEKYVPLELVVANHTNHLQTHHQRPSIFKECASL